MFAIVDIETTGSKFPGNRIIDLAIIRHNGKEVVSEWHSLLRPDVAIPPFVIELTGISEEMVADAPLFQDVAVDVIAQLRDCTFVAHDVNFDYSFLRHELKEVGYTLEMEKICTLKNSRKFLPGQASYSLGRLCTALGIVVDQRHRAIGDARATASLFSILHPHLMGFADFLTEGNIEVQLSELVRTTKSKK